MVVELHFASVRDPPSNFHLGQRSVAADVDMFSCCQYVEVLFRERHALCIECGANLIWPPVIRVPWPEDYHTSNWEGFQLISDILEVLVPKEFLLIHTREEQDLFIEPFRVAPVGIIVTYGVLKSCPDLFNLSRRHNAEMCIAYMTFPKFFGTCPMLLPWQTLAFGIHAQY